MFVYSIYESSLNLWQQIKIRVNCHNRDDKTHVSSLNASTLWITLDRKRGSTALSANPRYAEAISSINRARQIALESESRGLPSLLYENPPAGHVIGERWRTWARSNALGESFATGLAENACKTAREITKSPIGTTCYNERISPLIAHVIRWRRKGCFLCSFQRASSTWCVV